MRPAAGFAAGAALAVGAGLAFHGPLGAGERLAQRIERVARAELDRQEMAAISARLERRPLTRRLILAGPADDFQRSELIRILGVIPGVGEVRWDPASLVAEQVGDQAGAREAIPPGARAGR